MTNTLHNKLITIQSELKAPKNNINSFGKYKYRSCEDILEAVKPLLKEHNIALTISDEIVEKGGRIYVKAITSLRDCETTIPIETIGYAREAEFKKGMDEAQITGAASSYARKYALNGLFCIDDTKDSDATNDHKQCQTISKDLANNIINLIEKIYDLDNIKFCKAMKINAITELSIDKYDNTILRLNSKIEKQNANN